MAKAFKLLGWLLATSVLAGVGSAQAASFAVDDLSARAAGRANAGAAADTGADALWWNPAAIARAPRELSLGASYRKLSSDVTDAGSTISRAGAPAAPVGGASQVSDADDAFTAPNFAIATPIGDRFAVGLSVVRPFRLKGDLGASAWSRYDTIRNRIDTLDVQLTGAVKAADWLDLGFGVDAHQTKAALDSAYPNLSSALPDGLSQLVGDGWDYGWTAGAQAHLDRLTLGVSYRSKIEHKIDGTLQISGLLAPLDGSNFKASAKTALTTPWSAIVAARFAATPALTLSAQLTRSGWSEYDAITVAFAGQTAVIEQNYKDITAIAVGADYMLGPIWTLRGGVAFDPTPTPDGLREPGVTDSDRWRYAAGASVAIAPALTLNGALVYTDFTGSAVHDDVQFYAGTPAATTARLRGDFSGDALSVSAGLNWKF